jgi:hypothetical protein
MGYRASEDNGTVLFLPLHSGHTEICFLYNNKIIWEKEEPVEYKTTENL